MTPDCVSDPPEVVQFLEGPCSSRKHRIIKASVMFFNSIVSYGNFSFYLTELPSLQSLNLNRCCLRDDGCEKFSGNWIVMN